MLSTGRPVRLVGVLLAVGLITTAIATTGSTTVPAQRPTDVGNAACRPCHREIYDTYARTPMARTSGPARPGLIEGAFTHARSGIRYRVFAEGDQAMLSFERPGDRAVAGRVPLKYFVGSNTRGRTFLFSIDRFLYQSPINYYARARAWDMSPGYADLTTMPLNHVVDQTCLFCHASQVAMPATGTTNRFEGEAFGQDGVGCERCHGPGSAHAAGGGDMIDPAALAPEARDSICTQCHLEGQARIARAGRTLTGYRPGERLADSMAVFVFANAASAARGAVSHVESLAESVCKRKSGDRMSCLSCHNPHVQPEPAARAEYYRARCLQCHTTLAERHHPDQRDCVACHMPRVDSADIGHTAVTDHRILREQAAAQVRPLGDTLVLFGGTSPDSRDLGLAYADIALSGNAWAAHEARRLLEGVLPRGGSDPEVLTRLAYLEQAGNRLDRAEALYAHSIDVDPSQPVAATNLGVILAERGLTARALDVWRPAFTRHPEASELGVDLALASCKSGDWKGAEDELRTVLEHNPDFDSARQMAAALARGPDACRGD